MKKALLLVVILFAAVLSTACINNFAVQELNNKAKQALDSGDYETAINRLKSSIDLDSTIFETHFNLGIAYTQAEKYALAVDALNNATKLKPSFADTYYALAVAYENFGKSIINGETTLTGEKVEIKDDDTNKENIDDDNTKTPKTELSQEAKTKVVELYEESINAYNKYLDLEKTGKADKEEVVSRINYLQTQIMKYTVPSENN